MGRKKRFKGITYTPNMGVGDLCEIRIIQKQNTDLIGGPGQIAPSDFSGWYPGEVTATDTTQELPRGVSAVFSCTTITIRDGIEVESLGKDPPFRYEVRPLYRMLGTTDEVAPFQEGDLCIIEIGDFMQYAGLCQNPGLKVHAVRRIFPGELQGFWRGRILQVGHKEEGSLDYPIAAVIEDPTLQGNRSAKIRRWNNVEPPVRYTVRHQTINNRASMLLRRTWKDIWQHELNPFNSS